ncbi:MAG: hypothetical protein LAQ69_00205 [Acidobacteriia bacterium]|nr:hypothetical protein [Terriglobia bacterium]
MKIVWSRRATRQLIAVRDFGIYVVNAPDSESAKAILAGDPLIKGKLFTGEAIPFRTVFERGSPPPAGARGSK